MSDAIEKTRKRTYDEESTRGRAPVARNGKELSVTVALAHDLVLDAEEGVDVVYPIKS